MDIPTGKTALVTEYLLKLPRRRATERRGLCLPSSEWELPLVPAYTVLYGRVETRCPLLAHISTGFVQ